MQSRRKLTKSCTKTSIFTTLDTSRLKKIDDCENINSVNLLYLLINHTSGYIEEENGNKYLIHNLRVKTKKY